MKFSKPSEFVRELGLKKNKGKVITSTYIPQAQSRASKSESNLLTKFNVFDKKRLTVEKAKSHLDIVNTPENLADNFLGTTETGRPHTPIVYDNRITQLATLKVKIFAPLDRLLEKFKLFLFSRRKNARINTDKYWFKNTREFKESYRNATASKTFILKGRPRKISFPDPVPKVVLFSLRYPSPYPYIYHRVFYKYVKDKNDENKKNKNIEEKKESEE